MRPPGEKSTKAFNIKVFLTKSNESSPQRRSAPTYSPAHHYKKKNVERNNIIPIIKGYRARELTHLLD